MKAKKQYFNLFLIYVFKFYYYIYIHNSEDLDYSQITKRDVIVT